LFIQYDNLWNYITTNFKADISGIHGIQHWRSVELYGKLIAKHSGADEDVVRLFAILHDSERMSNGFDDEHGVRSAELALNLRGSFYQLDKKRFDLLCYACKWHTIGECSDDPTIGTCWDADRIDLQRVNATPDTDMMSTAFGKKLAMEWHLSKK
jgi:uncharacterized protein